MRHAAWILASFAVLGAAPASARPFYVIQSGPDAWTVMDPQGVERNGALRKAWAVRVQRNILSGNPPQPGYLRTLSEYDCDQHRARWREVFAFSRSGAQLAHTVNATPDWGPATDESDVEAAYRVVCEGVGGGAVVSADSVAKVVISLMGSWDPPPGAPGPAAGAPAKADPARGMATTAGPLKGAPPKAAPAAKPAPPKAKPKS